MDQRMEIEPVPDHAQREALRFLVAGRPRDVASALRAEAYEQMIDRCGGRCRLWWARRGRQCVAAVMVVPSAGRVGVLFLCPPEAPGVEGPCLPGVVRAASRQVLDDGLSFVQSLLPPSRLAEVDVLLSAGFRRLAELIYLQRALGVPVEPVQAREITWRNLRQCGQEELAAVIRGTYEQSLDCPGLMGLRRMDDIIAGHKASGVFRPKSWWIAHGAGEPVGCILVNDSAACPDSMDVVYMGVLRRFRGRGLGRTMVHHAAHRARRHKRSFLTVVVDGSNDYAKRVYEREGFRETSRRLAHILSGKPAGDAGSRGPCA